MWDLVGNIEEREKSRRRNGAASAIPHSLPVTREGSCRNALG
jgi:hypothetical protein